MSVGQYPLTRHLLYRNYLDCGDESNLHLFGQVKRIVRQWLDGYLVCTGGTTRFSSSLPGDRRHGLRVLFF